jgi:hypothetical protein
MSSGPKLRLTQKQKYTNTNTDKTCLRDGASLPRRLFYTANTHTAFNFLTVKERAALQTIFWFAVVAVVTYSYVFFKGFADGFYAPLSE